MLAKQIDIIYITRRNFLELVQQLSIEQLNEIPAGYNNNIAWNYGHIIASQQTLCYVRAGLQPKIEQSIIDRFQRGTKPTQFISKGEIENFHALLYSTIDVLKQDVEATIFDQYPTYKTAFGVEITSVQDAIQYFATHDALHFGYALSLKKNLTK